MNELQTMEEWQDALRQSDEHPVFVLKHSSTCPISAAGYEAFRGYVTDLPKYMVVVQTGKDISKQIADDLSVRHESPQAILVKGRKAVWHASHYDIQQENLQMAEQQNT